MSVLARFIRPLELCAKESVRAVSTASRQGSLGKAAIQVPEAKLEKPKLIIFDKDGTLICFHTMWVPWARTIAQRIEEGTGVNMSRQIYDLLGLCPSAEKVYQGLLAEGTMDQIRSKLMDLLLSHNVDVSRANLLVEECILESYKRCESEIRELHQLPYLFENLKDMDIKVAVCTADNRDSTISMLKKTNIEHMMDMIMCGDDEGSMPKPHPRNALAICQHLQVHPEETIMVGDTSADLLMARSAGLAAGVGVLSGVGSAEQLLKHCNTVVDHVGDLPQLF